METLLELTQGMLKSLVDQRKVPGFFTNVQNSDRLSSLVGDIHYVIMDYWVCVPKLSSQLHLTSTPDFITTRSL